MAVAGVAGLARGFASPWVPLYAALGLLMLPRFYGGFVEPG
jgi:hypothetical protein